MRPLPRSFPSHASPLPRTSVPRRFVGISSSLVPDATSDPTSMAQGNLAGSRSRKDLAELLKSYGIEPAFRFTEDVQRQTSGANDVKTLILRLEGGTALEGPRTVVCILPVRARMCYKRLSDTLGVARRRLGMASVAEAVESTGYPLGAIPPLGHARDALAVVLCQSVMDIKGPIYVGSGEHGYDLEIEVGALVSVVRPIVAPVSDPSAPPSLPGPSGAAPAPASSSSAPATESGPVSTSALSRLQSQAAPALRTRKAAPGSTLPLPPLGNSWRILPAPPTPPAADTAAAGAAPPAPPPALVQVEGYIAGRRRMAKHLLFATLVPPDYRWLSVVMSGGDRRAWGPPAAEPLPSGGAGAAGDARAAAIPPIDPPCDVQLIVGKTIERAVGKDAASVLISNLRVGTRVRITGRLQPHVDASGVERRDRMDLVCHVAEILSDIDASSEVVSAAAVLAESQRADAEAAERASAARGAKALQDDSGPPSRVAISDASPNNTPAAAAHRADGLPAAPRGSAGEPAAAGPSPSVHSGSLHGPHDPNAPWARRLRPDRITLVSDLAGLSDMATHLAEHPLSPVGCDAEWRPYGNDRVQRHKTPVSTLQISTGERGFVLDLLALCSSPFEPARAEPEPEGGLDKGRIREDHIGLSDTERALSDLLCGLFASERPKLGFLFAVDLERLQQSYPHLPCFGGWGRRAEGGVYAPNGVVQESPLRNYVEVMTAIRAASPLYASIPRLSLSRLVLMVLSEPLEKHEQTSDWGERPLTPEQLLYAGLDAHVLVRMWLRALDLEPGLARPDRMERLSGLLVDAGIGCQRRNTAAAEIWLSIVEGSGAAAAPRGAAAEGGSSARRSALRALVSEMGGGSGSGSSLQTQPLDSRDVRQGMYAYSPASASSNRKPLPTTAIRANIAAFEPYLHREMPGRGREAVIELACPPDAPIPRAPRGGGLVQFADSVFLFVTSGSGGKYANEFLEGGRYFTWFPGPEHHPSAGSHPAMRILKGCREAVSDNASPAPLPPSPSALLFLRFGKGPYRYLGRLACVEADWEANEGRGRFLLKLLDYSSSPVPLAMYL